MIKSFRKSLRKKSGKEKGQVLVIVALMLTMLIALIGLAIDSGYMYVSYARLRRASDAAALAATGEFKRSNSSNISTMINAMIGAAKQQLMLNGVVPKKDGDGNDMIVIKTCYNYPGDPAVCPAAGEDAEKKVYVQITTDVPTFFLAVVGFQSFPMTVSSTSEAASVDVVLVLDRSESMTYDAKSPSAMRDPHTCNQPTSDATGADGYKGDCHPFQELKKAAMDFAQYLLFYPYDRMAVVQFDQYAQTVLPMSTDVTKIQGAINDLTVTEGLLRCPYTRDLLTTTYGTTDPRQIPAPPPVAEAGYPGPPYTTDPGGTCRYFDHAGGTFLGMDCPMQYSLTPNPSRCGTTNIGDGVSEANRVLQAQYSDPSICGGTCPSERPNSLWVMVLLTDGAANAAYTVPAGGGPAVPICPTYTWTYDWNDTNKVQCNDINPGVRHSSRLPNGDPNPDYDADDYARDQFDQLANNTGTNGALIFTVGLSTQVRGNHGYGYVGESLLRYPQDTLQDGSYDYAPDGSSLNSIFLGIANKIATRISD